MTDYRGRRQGRGGSRGRGGYNRRDNRDDEIQRNDPIPIKRPPTRPISEEVQSQFRDFQRELDFRHDKHERLVKASRDITIESKRTIFLLHRAVASWTSSTDVENTLKEAEDRLASIRTHNWSRIGRELQGEDPYMFIRAYSPGLQEYIEAATFAYYLRNGNLLSLPDVRASLSNLPSSEDDSSVSSATDTSTVSSVDVPVVDYLCGAADLTGELMRAAINAIACGDQRRPQEICRFLTCLYSGFSLLGNSYPALSKDWSMKMRTFRQSLAKVENVCYILKLRGTEVPDYMLAEMVASHGASYSGAGDNLPVETHLEAW